MALPENDPRFRNVAPETTVERGHFVCDISDDEIREFESYCEQHPNAAFNYAMTAPEPAPRETSKDWIEDDGSDADFCERVQMNLLRRRCPLISRATTRCDQRRAAFL